jgi:hypothetical protein
MTTVQVDTSMAFKDIRDVMHVPLSLWDYLLIAGIVLLVLALAWFAWRWWKRRPEAEAPPVERIEPDVPAHVLARQRLSELEKKQLWQEGKHKQYQSEVTDIVRAYIEQRFNIPALEEITSEIVSDLALAGLDPSLVARSEAVLRLADQTKFARYTPSPAEHEAALRYAYEFVDATAPGSAQAPAVRDDGGGKA